MRRLDEQGSLVIPLAISVVLLICAFGFGIWAFAGRQEYKNNADQKVAEAVAAAKESLTIEKDAEFAEQYKLPYETYRGPAALGTLTVERPRTWSVYVNENASSSSDPLDGYMHPSYVPAGKSVNIALRFQVTNDSYEDELKSFESSLRNGKVSVAAYRLPKVASVLGSRITGEVVSGKQGDMIMLPLRDKTLFIWTEGGEFRSDFAKILETLTFVP